MNSGVPWYRRLPRRRGMWACIVVVGLVACWQGQRFLANWPMAHYWYYRASHRDEPATTPVFASGSEAIWTPQEWKEIQRYFGIAPPPVALVFMHGRRRPDGVERLVAVEIQHGPVYGDCTPVAMRVDFQSHVVGWAAGATPPLWDKTPPGPAST